MDPEQHEPLSEEELAEHERRVQQSSSVKPITLRWLEYTTLVAEVRRLQTELREFKEDDGVSGTPEDDYLWNATRLRELLLKHGDHMPACDLWLNSGSTCSCGWDAVERELAGEGKEA